MFLVPIKIYFRNLATGIVHNFAFGHFSLSLIVKGLQFEGTKVLPLQRSRRANKFYSLTLRSHILSIQPGALFHIQLSSGNIAFYICIFFHLVAVHVATFPFLFIVLFSVSLTFLYIYIYRLIGFYFLRTVSCNERSE